MRSPPLQNPTPQTPVLPGFVVFGFPKVRGLTGSARAARSLETLPFERVQTTPRLTHSPLRLALDQASSCAFERVQSIRQLSAGHLVPLRCSPSVRFERVQINPARWPSRDMNAPEPVPRSGFEFVQWRSNRSDLRHSPTPIARAPSAPWPVRGATGLPAAVRACARHRYSRLERYGLFERVQLVPDLPPHLDRLPPHGDQELLGPPPGVLPSYRAAPLHLLQDEVRQGLHPALAHDRVTLFERVQTNAPTAPPATRTPFKLTTRHSFERVQTARQQPTLLSNHPNRGGIPMHPSQ